MSITLDEVWLTCEEFPDYSISSHGRVRNEHRQSIVQQSLTLQGAPKVSLSGDGVRRTLSVKVLVADLFVENDRDPEIFNTPIHLDGDQTNCRCENLMWRPRWFACKYTQQFTAVKRYEGVGPIVNLKSGMVFEDIVHASTVNGLLFKDLEESIHANGVVFPSYQMFDWAK